ncbi:MAG TPA: helix-turn-helix domain-containing protein [Gemmatimonadaceae bacterium]|nr:helix-turn-helix domain-containing protein [Gemmatimonadaceae bacterium]
MDGESEAQDDRGPGSLTYATRRMRVVALLVDERDRRLVAETLGPRAKLHFCERSSELFRLATDLRANMVIADSVDIDGDSTAPALHSLRAALPLLQVVLYIDLSIRAVRSAIEGWATGVVFRQEEDVGAMLRTAVVRSPSMGSPGATIAISAGLVPPEVRRFLTHCAWRATTIRTARSAADDVGIPYRTLARRLQSAGLPSPKVLLDWCRLLHAAWRVERTHENRDIVARSSGFSSGDVLARRLRLYTGLSWTTLRERVGFDKLLTMFETMLRTAPDREPDWDETREQQENPA